jgi:hypothetical protein
VAKPSKKKTKKPRLAKIRIPLPFEKAVEGLVRVKIKKPKKDAE